MFIKREKSIVTDVRFKKKDNLHPIIVSFQNGALQPEMAHTFDCQVHNDVYNEGKRIVEMSSSEGMVYRGSDASHDTKICRTLLAVRNKITSDVRMVEVDSVQLAPVFHNDALETSGIPGKDNTGQSILNKTFGSKRIKRRTELKERMVFEVNSMANQLNQAASGIEINEQELSKPALDILDSLIPCNRLASSVEEVYKLQDIISQNELDSLQEEAERILENIDSIPEDQYSKYFNHYVRNLPNDNKLQYVEMLLYAECLLYLYCLHSSEVRKKYLCVCPVSEAVNSKILDNFTIMRTSRLCPLQMHDKILCHVLILGILANNYVLNIEPLIKTPKIKGVRVLEMCRVLGLVTASKDGPTTVALKFPLPTPANLESRKRKRK